MEIVKLCNVHGELTEEFVRREKRARDGRVLVRCSYCKAEKGKKYYDKNFKELIKKASDWKKENRQRVRDLSNQDRINNPEKWKKWAKDNRERQGSKRITQEILRSRGMTIEQYEKLKLEHNNLCGICFQEETRKSRTPGKITRLAIDHCHKTGKVRGLLCHSCNTAIGKLKDSLELIDSARRYLEKYLDD